MSAPSLCIHLPRDLEAPGGPAARLRAALRAVRPGEPQLAALAVAFLWKLCAFLALNARPDALGRLPSEDRVLFESDFPADFGEVVPLFEQAGLLVPDDGGWACPLFQQHNGHLTGKRGSLDPSMGGQMKAFWGPVKKLLQAGPEQLPLWVSDRFVAEDGVGFSGDQVRGIQALVIALDGVTDRAVPRDVQHAADWPVDTVRTAAGVLSLKPLEHLLYAVADLKKLGLLTHPAVPRTTELCLPRFASLLELVERARAERKR